MVKGTAPRLSVSPRRSRTPLDSGNAVGGRALAVGPEDLDGNDSGVLGHADELARRRASDVGAMAVFIRVLHVLDVSYLSSL